MSTLSTDKICDDENICETCSDSNNCNLRTIDREHCYSCNSLNDPNCDEEPIVDWSIPCSDEIVLREIGCFRKETGEGKN